LPTYDTTLDVSNYSAAFISTVEIQGATFRGEPGNTKKQAEMNAAKIAFQHFKDSKSLSYCHSFLHIKNKLAYHSNRFAIIFSIHYMRSMMAFMF